MLEKPSRTLQSSFNPLVNLHQHTCVLSHLKIDSSFCKVCPAVGRVEVMPVGYRVLCKAELTERTVMHSFEPPKISEVYQSRFGRDLLSLESHTWIEQEIEGSRAFVHLLPTGVVLTSLRRRIGGVHFQFQANVPHFRDSPELTSLAASGYTVLDCVLVMPSRGPLGLKSSSVVIGATSHKALSIQAKLGLAKLVVVDAPYLLGDSVVAQSFQARRGLLEHVYGSFVDSTDLSQYMSLSVGQTLDAAERESFYEQVVLGGGSGVVVRSLDSLYFDNSAALRVDFSMVINVQVVGFARVKDAWAIQYFRVAVRDASSGQLREVGRVTPSESSNRRDYFILLKHLSESQIILMNIVLRVRVPLWERGKDLYSPSILDYCRDPAAPVTFDFERWRVVDEPTSMTVATDSRQPIISLLR